MRRSIAVAATVTAAMAVPGTASADRGGNFPEQASPTQGCASYFQHVILGQAPQRADEHAVARATAVYADACLGGP